MERMMKFSNITIYGLMDLAKRRQVDYELQKAIKMLPAYKTKTVSHGPFAGLLFPAGSRPENTPALAAMLLGSFEVELHNIISTLVEKQFKTIINVGAAEGYYAVGMALKCPQSNIVAFEMDEVMQQRCCDMAIVNGVKDKLTILGECSAKSFDDMKLDNILIIMDCEGAEADILDDGCVNKLKKSWLLIELHDALRPGCSRAIHKRFFKTHDMKFISSSYRDPGQFNLPEKLTRRQKKILLDEKRLGVQEWVLLSPMET
jgi:hypothetical protein